MWALYKAIALFLAFVSWGFAAAETPVNRIDFHEAGSDGCISFSIEDGSRLRFEEGNIIFSNGSSTITLPAGRNRVIEFSFDRDLASVQETADNPEGEDVYYTLSGIRISGTGLSPGIYFKRNGSKTEKVIIMH